MSFQTPRLMKIKCGVLPKFYGYLLNADQMSELFWWVTNPEYKTDILHS